MLEGQSEISAVYTRMDKLELEVEKLKVENQSLRAYSSFYQPSVLPNLTRPPPAPLQMDIKKDEMEIEIQSFRTQLRNLEQNLFEEQESVREHQDQKDELKEVLTKVEEDLKIAKDQGTKTRLES